MPKKNTPPNLNIQYDELSKQIDELTQKRILTDKIKTKGNKDPYYF